MTNRQNYLVLSILMALSLQANAISAEKCLNVYSDIQTQRANHETAFALGFIGSTAAGIGGATTGPFVVGAALGGTVGGLVGATTEAPTRDQIRFLNSYGAAVVGSVTEGISGAGGIASQNLIKIINETLNVQLPVDANQMAALIAKLYNEEKLCKENRRAPEYSYLTVQQLAEALAAEMKSE